MVDNDNILDVTGLKTHFPVRGGWFSARRHVRAVDGVDFSVRRGSTLGLVGESGSGKTTVGRSILHLIPPTAGRIVFDGQDISRLGRAAMRQLRRRMQIIFQDPVSSLNPRMTVGDIIAEPLAVHRIVPRRQRRRRAAELLERVGLSAGYAGRYPHEFSGGQRQRIGIARALASKPDFIVCDEPVSALDVSIQAQILNLLSDLQEEMNLSYLFIAHNLAVVEHFSDELAVMYLGKIVEHAPAAAIYRQPMHPYTEALLSAAPQPVVQSGQTIVRLTGEMPSPINPPSGCPFHPRCPLTRKLAAEMPQREICLLAAPGEPLRVVKACVETPPQLLAMPNEPDHRHACLLRQP